MYRDYIIIDASFNFTPCIQKDATSLFIASKYRQKHVKHRNFRQNFVPNEVQLKLPRIKNFYFSVSNLEEEFDAGERKQNSYS